MNYARAAAMFKKFNGFAPSRVAVSDVQFGKGEKTSMVFLGKAAEIKYLSEKDIGKGRKKRGYVHRFGRTARLWATEIRENGRKRVALCVLGGGLKVTRRGIEG